MGKEDDDSEEEMRTTLIPMNSWLALTRERRIGRLCFTRMRRTTVGTAAMIDRSPRIFRTLRGQGQVQSASTAFFGQFDSSISRRLFKAYHCFDQPDHRHFGLAAYGAFLEKKPIFFVSRRQEAMCSLTPAPVTRDARGEELLAKTLRDLEQTKASLTLTLTLSKWLVDLAGLSHRGSSW